MAELFEEVVGLLESRSSTRALATRFRIESEQAASNGAVLGVPVFITALNDWANDPGRFATLLKTLQSAETSGLRNPGATFETRSYDPIGTEVTDMLLGDSRAKVASVISGEAGISERSANGLLPPTAWALMTTIADRYGNRIDRQSLIAILSREQQDLIDGGWGAWLDATSDQAMSQPAPVGHRQSAGVADVSGQHGAHYPPPVARSARLVEDDTLALTPTEARGANGMSPSVTGPVSHNRPRPERPDRDRLPRRRERSRLPILLGAALLLLLGGAMAWWLLTQQGDSDTDVAGIAAEEGEAETASGSADDAEDSVEAPAEMLAIDVMMDDPEGRSESTGLAELRFDVEGGQICYNVNAELIGSPYDGHIHVGPAGVKGGIVVDFGLLNNSDIGCTAVSPTEIETILADQAGHYVEMHDPSGDFTIRAQLSEAMPEGADAAAPDEPAEELLFDPASGGAGARVESGVVILEGAVADQETFDRLVAEFDGIDEVGLELVNDLTIEPGSPLPTGGIEIDNSILFAVNDDQLSGDRGTVIADVAALLSVRPDWTVTVVGHTDSTGDEVYNLELSLRRAEAVRGELIANGVSTTNLGVRGAGSTDPVADNDTPEGRALNRRIEFEIDRG